METKSGFDGQNNRKRGHPAPDDHGIAPKTPSVDNECASDASDDTFREPTRASFYRDSDDEGTSTLAVNGLGASNRLRFDNDTSSDDNIEITGTVVPQKKPHAAKAKTAPHPGYASAHNGRQSRIDSAPAPDEKLLLEVWIIVKFDNGEGDIPGALSVLHGTTIAGLLHTTRTEYSDAFTQHWPHVIISQWNERFQRAVPIPESEYARKLCEEGATYEAFFFMHSASLHKRFWFPVRVVPEQPNVERPDRNRQRRRRSRAVNTLTTPRNQDTIQRAPDRSADDPRSAAATTDQATTQISVPAAPRFEGAVEPVKVVLVQCDITTLEVDAIVNAANAGLKRGGGVCGSIFAAAGTDLDAECDSLNGCSTGDAVLTAPHGLRQVKAIVHAVGLKVVGALTDVHRQQLASCYRRGMEVAVQRGLTSIAFPCISTALYGFPNVDAAHIAISAVKRWIDGAATSAKISKVVFCTFLKKDLFVYQELLPDFFPGFTDETVHVMAHSSS